MSPRKRGLGRGLDALLPEPAQRGSIESVAVDRLRPNRMQPRTRFDETGLEELAESIRSQGVIQPLVVAPRPDGTYTIVAGERRWRAARHAGLAQVPVVVREATGDRELLELALVENLQRADLDPLEEAEAYRALAATFGLSQDEIAVRVGKARTTVTNALRLLKLPAEIQDLLRDGRLSAGQARPLLALRDEKTMVALARRAASEGLSARQVEARVAGPRPARRPARRKVEAHTRDAEEQLTQKLKTRVEIHRRGRGGTIRIRFHSEDELIGLFDRLMGDS